MTPLKIFSPGVYELSFYEIPPKCIRYDIIVLPVLAGVDNDRPLEHVATDRTQKPRIYFIRHDHRYSLWGCGLYLWAGFKINHAHYTAACSASASEVPGFRMATFLLSQNEREYIVNGVREDLRADGRACTDYRHFKVRTGVVSNTSGSAKIELVNKIKYCTILHIQ